MSNVRILPTAAFPEKCLPFAMAMFLLCTGCASHLPGPSKWQAASAEKLQKIQELKDQEEKAADKALVEYQKVLQATKVEHPYPHYQDRLQEAISLLQSNPGDAKLMDDADLGLPSLYAQRLQVLVNAHHGLARVSKIRGDFESALSEVEQSVALTKDFGAFMPNWTAQSLLVSYQIKHEVCTGKGLTGQALVAKLNADMLEDHLASEGGKEDAAAEQKFLSGEETQNQMNELEAFIGQVNTYRSEQASQTRNSVMSGLLQANSMVQSLNATKALSQSGGMLTPKVQLAQMNAQMAQMQAVMFTSLVTGKTALSPQFATGGSQWAVPSFGQQMVDPRQGVNARGIVKSFAALAAERSGNPNLQTSAGSILTAVDALPTVQNGQLNGDVTNRITEFAGLLNPFIEQVMQVTSQR